MTEYEIKQAAKFWGYDARSISDLAQKLEANGIIISAAIMDDILALSRVDRNCKYLMALLNIVGSWEIIDMIHDCLY